MKFRTLVEVVVLVAFCVAAYAWVDIDQKNHQAEIKRLEKREFKGLFGFELAETDKERQVQSNWVWDRVMNLEQESSMSNTDYEVNSQFGTEESKKKYLSDQRRLKDQSAERYESAYKAAFRSGFKVPRSLKYDSPPYP
jgi:hypothetical protein